MRLITTPDIDIRYATTDKDMKEVISFCKDTDLLATDTETKVDLTKIDATALDAHSAEISLVQVNHRDCAEPYLIDFLSISPDAKAEFNQEVLMNNNIRKILHNARFDLKQFYNEFKTWPVNVWCTMVLMKSLGICTGMKASIFRGHGLKDMARDYFDLDLDKAEAVSQWGARPLRNEQFGYAGLDVGAPKSADFKCLLLEGYHLFKDQLDALGQKVAYTADQEAMLVSAKMEYIGMYIDTDILRKIYDYAVEQTNSYRKYLVEELGFTVYYDTDIDDDGEWISIQVIPDKIKKLLNNNKGLVSYINNHMANRGESILSSLQAEEVKNYLDLLEADTDDQEGYDEDYLNYKYDSIKLIKSLLKYKKFNKLVSECEKYFKVINKNTGRVHAGFNSVGTATGRMSSSGKLNLQQVSNSQVVIKLPMNKF